jgi:hypothetical protein
MLESMADAPVSADASDGTPGNTQWRYTRWGSVVLSIDFLYGVPAGIALGLLPGLNMAAAGNATVILIAFGGALVAMAAVVVAVKAMFVTLLSPEYTAALERAEGGVRAAARPFIIVAWVCTVGAFTSFAAALSWPALPGHSWYLRWLTFAIPAALTGWALLGSAQLVSLGAFHIEQRSILLNAIQEFRRHRDKRSALSPAVIHRHHEQLPIWAQAG